MKPGNWVHGHPEDSKLNLFEAFLKNLLQRIDARPDVKASTAIFITFDEAGGYYDSGFIQPLDFFGDGPRVPFLVVSPYSRGGRVVQTYTDHVSILKFIERNWLLGPLTDRSRDNLPAVVLDPANSYVPANMPAIGDLFDMFDFSTEANPPGTPTTLFTTVSGQVGGSVTSTPGGISCASPCSTTVLVGAQVVLTAVSSFDAGFAGWSGGTCGGTALTCAVAITGATTVSATFIRRTFTLTVMLQGSAAAGGSVSASGAALSCAVTCSAAVTTGTTVTLSARPGPGDVFVQWTGACSTASLTCSVPMSATRSVSAYFATPVTLPVTTFTDDPLLAARTGLGHIHIVELRAAIDALRRRDGLPVSAWTDPVIVRRQTRIRAVHVTELRVALNDVYQARGLGLPTYVDPVIVARQTLIKAMHIRELRTAAAALP